LLSSQSTALAQGQADLPKQSALLLLTKLRAWVFLILLVIVFEIWSHIAYDRSFLANTYNLRSLAIFAAVPLLLALGQTFVIISAGIDLSVGFIMGLAAVISAHAVGFLGDVGLPSVLAAVLGISFACVVAVIPGLINGWLVAALGIPPFIGTLGMYGVARGAAFLFAGGMTVAVSNETMKFLGNGKLLGVPILVFIVAALCLVAHYLLSQTRFGQHTYAMGANKAAADRAGINTRNLTIKIYALAGLFAGVAGALYTARFSAGAAQAGEPLLLISIAIVVIGGASLFGGSGTVSGTIAGALVIAVIQYGLVYVNIEPFWQFIAVGVVIIISVFVDQLQSKMWGAK
jgi:ribose transport system permease protein